MELKEAFIQSSKELFHLYEIKTEFKGEVEKNSLSSTEQVNILISFSANIKGNVVFGFTRPTALNIASILDGEQMEALDQKARGKLGEIARFIVDLALSKSHMSNKISLSPPIVITGDNIFLTISRVKTVQINFGLNEEPVSIAYYVEQGAKNNSPF